MSHVHAHVDEPSTLSTHTSSHAARAPAPPVEATLQPLFRPEGALLRQCALPQSPILPREFSVSKALRKHPIHSLHIRNHPHSLAIQVLSRPPRPIQPSSTCPSPCTLSHRCSGVAVGRDQAPLLGGARAARRLPAARRRRTIDLAGRANDGRQPRGLVGVYVGVPVARARPVR